MTTTTQFKKYIATITYAKADYELFNARNNAYWHNAHDLQQDPAAQAQWDAIYHGAMGMVTAFQLAGFSDSIPRKISAQLTAPLNDLSGDLDEPDFKFWDKDDTLKAIDLLIRFSEDAEDKAAIDACRDDIIACFHRN